MLGRCTLTTTSSPLGNVAAWTWAKEAAAIGCGSRVAKTSSDARPSSWVITFGSGATARHFVTELTQAGLDPAAVFREAAIASVGPVTTAGIRKLGYEVDIEAPTATMESLVAAIVAEFAAGEAP